MMKRVTLLRTGLAALLPALSLFAQADTRSFAERYGPAVGAPVPSFTALDQNGATRTLKSLAGPRGTWLLFFRSADWCVYCKTQLVELGMHAEAIRKLGYGVAALSYDSPAALAHFAKRKQLTIPLLSDPDSKVIDAFGIRNETIQSGFAKGVPHPGLFLIDAAGNVEAKYFEADYRERITVSSILTGRFGERATPAGPPVERARIRVTPTASATVVQGGQHILLSLELMLGNGLHAYAPGAPEEFITVSWKLTDSPFWKSAAPQWPKPEMGKLYGYDELIPNYTGLFRAHREITLAPQPMLVKDVPSGELIVTGEFRYQACNDRACFPPETVPVTWKLIVGGQDRERLPKELQRSGF